MKKVIIFTILVVVLFSTALSETIGFDVTALTDEELNSLNQQLQAELYRRHIAGEGVTVPPGRYTVGVDIPAGRYQVIVDETVAAETIEVYKDEKTSFGKSYWLGTMYGGTTANIDLKDGGVLEITSHTVTLRIFTSLFTP